MEEKKGDLDNNRKRTSTVTAQEKFTQFKKDVESSVRRETIQKTWRNRKKGLHRQETRRN